MIQDIRCVKLTAVGFIVHLIDMDRDLVVSNLDGASWPERDLWVSAWAATGASLEGGLEHVTSVSMFSFASDLKGLVLTCPGAGGGQGPADPLGAGGGGTYGG